MFVGSWPGASDVSVSNLTLPLREGVVGVRPAAGGGGGGGDGGGGENVLFIVQDDTGHEQQGGAGRMRGVVNATLLGGGGGGDGEGEVGFVGWMVAGTAGGSEGGLDAVRTGYNEGGLSAERLGWHLGGFDDAGWEEGAPGEGFEGAGVRFYRGKLGLKVPPGLDVSLAVRFGPVVDGDVENGRRGFRVLLFVNGWQYGRYYPWIADEDTFPVPVGVLDYKGENVIGLAVWALQEEGARVDVEVVVRYVVGSSLDVRFDGSYLRPGWDASRLKYA